MDPIQDLLVKAVKLSAYERVLLAQRILETITELGQGSDEDDGLDEGEKRRNPEVTRDSV